MSPSSRDRSKALSDEAIDWLVRLRAGPTDPCLEEQFAGWLAQSPEHRHAFDEACTLWEAMIGSIAREADATAPSQPTIPAPSRRRRSPAALAVAALLLLALGLRGPGLVDWWQSDYITGTGEQRQLSLEDGSRVILNTDTAVAMDWSATARRLRLLHGEAVFHVAADASRPFEVEANGTLVRALGTVFDVAVHGAEGITVVVQEHAISVRPLGAPLEFATTVAEGQQLRYRDDGARTAPESADLGTATAWQRGKLIWKEQPLEQVVEELNRYRPGKILIAGSGLAQLRVSGVFALDDADGTLDAVEQALGLRSTRLSPWLVLLHA